MGFRVNSLYYSDGYKVGHKRMLAKNTTKLYGTLIPRNIKYAPKGINKIVVFGEQLATIWLHDEFHDNFFTQPIEVALKFQRDISMYLGIEYDADHFIALHKLGYLPIRVKSLPEGVETDPNIPHMTFINTVDGYAWLTLYLETILSSLIWKPSTSATLALAYRRRAYEWIMKTDPSNILLLNFLCHDFSARGLSPWDMIASGLGHATSFRGSDTLVVIPAARYFYNVPENVVCINSVNASEHSVSTTKIFTVGEKQMIIDWLKEFPVGILSIVADTFDLWKLLLEYLSDPEVKALIMARDGKLVVRPDSGDPVDITCGKLGYVDSIADTYSNFDPKDRASGKGVIEILWDEFGGTINEQGYKVLDSHIGAIYGDSINLDRQLQIYERLADKGFASTNIVLGVGSFTYQYNSRDTLGFAIKGAWFECDGKGYNIFKDPITDDGTKKSKKGLLMVELDENGDYILHEECTFEQEAKGELRIIYEDGIFYNQVSLDEIREKISKLSENAVVLPA